MNRDEAQKAYRKRLVMGILIAAAINVLLVLFVPGFRQAVKESLRMVSLADERKAPTLPPSEPPHIVRAPKVKFTPIAGTVSGLAPVSSDSAYALDGPGLNIGPIVRTPGTSKPIPMQSLGVMMLPGTFSGGVAPTAKSISDISMPAPAEMQGTGKIVSAPLPSFDITNEINAILPSGPVSLPSVIGNIKEKVKSFYPEEARVAGIEGKIVLKIVILFDGTVGDIEIFQSSGRDDFDQAAKECIKQLQFKPAMQSGIRVTMAVLFPITFELTND
jgi:TonB family protein